MRVLIINTFVEGTSTAKIAVGLYNKLKKNGHECLILYGSGGGHNNPDFIKISSELDIKLSWLHNQFTGIHGKCAPFAMKRVYELVEKFQPDIVQLYNLHFYYLNIYKLFEYLKRKNIPTVYGMLDEYPYMGYCCYPYDCEKYKFGCKQCGNKRFRREYPRSLLWTNAKKTIKLKEKSYNNFPNLVFTGPEFVIARAKESYLLKNKTLQILDEYVDNETLFMPKRTQALRSELGIPENNVILLNVAPSSDPRKGVADYVDLARRVKDVRYTFVHVGYQGDVSQLPSNFIAIPFVKDQVKLAEYYSMADLFICTSYADTMPNVCLDAMSCGTSVLGYKISGVPYVAEEPIGHFVTAGDVQELYEFVMSTKKKTKQDIEICREYALKRYSPQAYYEQSIMIYNRLLVKEESREDGIC